jgi:hypothetical protein
LLSESRPVTPHSPSLAAPMKDFGHDLGHVTGLTGPERPI